MSALTLELRSEPNQRLDLSPLREIGIAQDGEQPGLEVGALVKRVEVIPRLEQSFLHEIVRVLAIATQRHGKGAKIGHLADERLSQAFRHSTSQLLVSASLEVFQKLKQTIGDWFSRNLVINGAQMTADMGLQIRR